MTTKRNKTTRIIYPLLAFIAIVGVVFMFLPKEDSSIKLRGQVTWSADDKKVINTYLKWAEYATEEQLSTRHDFVAEGLTKMADALQVISTKASRKVGDDSKASVDTIKAMSNLLVQDPKSSMHADMIKKAFTASEKVVTLVQIHSSPELDDEIEILKQKISAIKTGKPALVQKTQIVQSFQQVAVLLKRMIMDENKNLE